MTRIIQVSTLGHSMVRLLVTQKQDRHIYCITPHWASLSIYSALYRRGFRNL